MAKKKIAIAGILTVTAAQLKLFSVIGLLFIEDLLALKIGAKYGVTWGTALLAVSVGLLIWHIIERK